MLLTKLHIPTPGKNQIKRTALIEKLNAGLKSKLILISAPAGFGKTTIVCEWIEQQQTPTAWYSIDSNDNNPTEFLQYMVAAIQTIDHKFGEKAAEVLKSPGQTSPEAIVSLLINDMLNFKKDLILVLDDFHLISNPEINEMMSFMLEHIPGHLHIVLSTRSDPMLPLPRLRVQQQLVELRTEDLSFSAQEIALLFNKPLKIKLTEKDIFALQSKTEGWIAGLQLTALSLQNKKNISEFIRDLKGDNRYIMDYLMEEVLKIQSEKTKDFLLKTSILEQLSAPLCDAMLDRSDSHFTLESLEKNNMFIVPLDDERQWYRYHHLFSHLLKQRLMVSYKNIVPELHDKASHWFGENELQELAIEHALRANNYIKSIEMLGQIAESLWQNGHHAAILNFGERIPDEVIKSNSEFCFYYSWVLIISGKISKAEPFIDSAEKTSTEIIQHKKSTEAEIAYHKKLLGKISVALAYLHSHKEPSREVFSYCETAMENLSENDPLWFGWAWFSYAVTHFSLGELDNSRVAFEKALNYSKKTGNIYQISTIVIRLVENEQQLGHYTSAYQKCKELINYMKEKDYLQLAKEEWTFAALYLIMGVTEIMWVQTEKSLENIEKAYELSKKGKDIFLKTFILMAYSAILKEMGNPDAENKAQELEDLILQHQLPPFLYSFYVGWKVHFCLMNEEFEQAEHILNENNYNIENRIEYSKQGAYSSYVNLLLAQQKLNEAELIIKKLLPIAINGKQVERLIELKIASARLNNLKGDKSKAISLLFEAMEIASTENLISYFVYNKERIEDILEEAVKVHATTQTNIPEQFIKKIKNSIEKHEKNKHKKPTIEISSRELDTLKQMAEGLTNQEIADKLFISANTVKTHLKNLFLKLEVDNRQSAVEKARELKLL